MLLRLCFLLLLCLISRSRSNSSWVKYVDAKFHSNLSNIGAVYTAAHYTESSGGVQTLQVVFVERWVTWDPMRPRLKATPWMGLNMSQSLNKTAVGWNYMRLFARDADHNCPSAGAVGPHDKDLPKPHRCFASSTHKAWWIERGVFQMNISLVHGKKYVLSLVQGMEGCVPAFEELSVATAHRDLCYVRDGSILYYPTNETYHVLIGKDIKFVEANPDHPKEPTSGCKHLCEIFDRSTILYGGTMKPTPPTLVEFTTHLPSETNEKTQLDACNSYQDLSGTWIKNNRIHSKLSCPNKIPTRAMSQQTCIIGDSHMARAYELLGRSFTVRKNIVQNNFDPIHTKVNGSRVPWSSGGQTMLHHMMQCINGMGRTGSTIWWWGSHAETFSPQNVKNAVHDMMREVRNRKHREYIPCIVIVGTPDAQHETIPNKFMDVQPYYRNSWRIQLQNQALRETVEEIIEDYGNLSNIHYFDIFEPSAALHFDGYRRDDPVHQSNAFYVTFVRMIIQAAKNMCMR